MKIFVTSTLFLASALILLQAQPALTIYNQNFAVVRDKVPVQLSKGQTSVTFDGATMMLEPDSVILRDPAGTPLNVLEQNYRNDPVSQERLLQIFEGKSIEFLIQETAKPDRMISGKIIRSGYVPPNAAGTGFPMPGGNVPIIEIEGAVRFGLPGQPLFPSLGDGTILKPQLSWVISSPKEVKLDAELAYITGGMSWLASYNIVLPPKGDRVDVVGWITMENQTGRDFVDANIKLMAGDVNKVQPQALGVSKMRANVAFDMEAAAPAVTEKTFDEYHLYTLARPTTLRDRETKQVEFVRASDVQSETLYIFDGVGSDWLRYRGWDDMARRENPEFGLGGGNQKVTVVRQFLNTKENNLGLPLPKGRVRFYRSDDDGRMEFIGENQIDHTPVDETIRIVTGESFDLVGERKRTNFQVDSANNRAEESFEIQLRNRKKEAVEIRVVDYLNRSNNWIITAKSQDYKKVNSHEIEFLVPLAAGEEKTVTYTVKYTW